MICPRCGVDNADGGTTCRGCQRDLSELGATVAREMTMEQTAPESAGDSRASRPKSGSFETGKDLNQRYHIVRQLGEGGMGEVYLAQDRELNRDVALKVIRIDLAQHPQILERFRREIQLSSKVTHKHVLRVYDLGEAAGVKFLTMEYIDGYDLASLLRREGKLPIPRVLTIFRQICEGLAAAHDEGVIHRDLKPQNILIDRNGRVAIADFGLAKSFEQVSLTEAGKVIGTPHYMSPEQVKGVALDHRTDIYSLGIILFEMLTGKLPFTGSTPFEVMMQRVNRPSPLASDHNPQIPPYLIKVLQRCMERDPGLRYQSAAEILRDLDAQTFHSTIGYRVRQNRRVSVVLAAVLGIVLVAGGVTAWRTFRATKQRATEAAHKPVSVLIADLQNNTGDAVFDGTLEPILTLALEGATFINSYNRAQARRIGGQLRPNETALSEPLARLVAVREGLNVVVGGTIDRDSDSYRLALTAVDPTNGKPIQKSEVSASTKEQMLTAVGRAAADLRKALGDTTPESVQIAAAETFSAGSLEAAHEYAQAQDLFYRGKFDDAATHFDRAIKLDPNLGRAYAGLASAYANMGRKGDAETYYKLAMSRMDRMSDREKYRTRSGYYLMTRNNARAIEELTLLVNQYPVDMAGLNNLPIAYFYSRDMGRAMQESQRVLSVYPKNYVARNNAALYAMYAGEFAAAAKEAQTVLTMNPGYLKAYVAIALSQLGQNDPAAATQTYNRLASQSAAGRSMAANGLADLALYQGRAADAVRILPEEIDRDLADKRVDAANRKLAMLAAARLQVGDRKGAIAAAEEAAKNAATSRDEHTLYTAAHVLLEAGEESRAQAVASQLSAAIEPEPQLYGKLIEGEALLRRGSTRDALARFEDAKRLGDAWLVRFNRGRANLELGAFTEAGADLEVCLKRRGEATAVFLDDVPTFHYFPPVYYYLGRAQEGLGSAGAAESYKQFVAIKTNGDGDPLVADARRRLGAAK